MSKIQVLLVKIFGSGGQLFDLNVFQSFSELEHICFQRSS